MRRSRNDAPPHQQILAARRRHVADLAARALPEPARSRALEALGLARWGFCLVPMAPRSKRPATRFLPRVDGRPSWRVLAVKRPTELELVHWFEAEPEVGVAAILGSASGGIIAVDIDHPDKLPPFLRLPATAASDSSACAEGWRGHLFYRTGDQVPSRHAAWGDVLGEGKLVILPPSIHPSGLPYRWSFGLGLGDIDVALAPAWVWRSDGSPGVARHSSVAAAPDTSCADSARVGRQWEQPAPLGAAARARRGGRQHAAGAESAPRNGNTSFLGARFLGAHGRALVDALARDPDVGLAIARDAGLRVGRIPASCRCPWDKGGDERHASVSLYQDACTKIVAVKDHHRAGLPIALPRVWAWRICGRLWDMNAFELALWQIRAAAAVGAVELPAIAARRLPAKAAASTRKVYEGFLLNLAVRSRYDARQTACTFGWDFAARWCGLERTTAGRQVTWLLRNGFIEPVGHTASKSRFGQPLVIYALGRQESGR